jgi:hypothetical protein
MEIGSAKVDTQRFLDALQLARLRLLSGRGRFVAVTAAATSTRVVNAENRLRLVRVRATSNSAAIVLLILSMGEFNPNNAPSAETSGFEMLYLAVRDATQAEQQTVEYLLAPNEVLYAGVPGAGVEAELNIVTVELKV